MNYLAFKQYKYVQTDADGRKTLTVNINPEKACIFNCRICNVGRTKYQGEWHDFGPIEDSLDALRKKIAEEKPDIVEITGGKGDPLVNVHVEEIIDCVHALGLPVRLITNCYLLGIGGHMKAACLCEEVVAGFCFTREREFRNIHRPRDIDGFTAEKQTESMIAFGENYKGKFTLRVLLVKDNNDSDAQVEELKKVVDRIKKTKLWVGTWPRFNVSDERVAEISAVLNAR